MAYLIRGIDGFILFFICPLISYAVVSVVNYDLLLPPQLRSAHKA